MSRTTNPKSRRRGETTAGPAAVETHTHRFTVAEITGETENVPITTYVDRVSDDNRRRYRQEFPVEQPSPVKRQRVAERNAAAPPLTETARNDWVGPARYEMGLDMQEEQDELQPAAEAEPLPSRIVKPSDPALHRFRDRHDHILANILRRKGTRNAETCFCRVCRNPTVTPEFRCRECWGDDLLCRKCMVARHAENPLHQVQKWTGRVFESTTLKALGLRVQLGHRPRERCLEPKELHSHFVIIHHNGIQEVAIDCCDCAENRLAAGSPKEQLLRVGWFPATEDRPRTCATFAALDFFLISTHQAKTTMYDFYAMLERLTNNAGVKPPYRYHAWLRMCREYRHLLMLLRAGRAHEEGGVLATAAGELAVFCPCCPNPEVNLPPNWHEAPDGQKFLYILFLAIDACFRLKRRLVSSYLKDPPLLPGSAYLVDYRPFREYLLTVTDQKEMSTCSGLAALDHANTKFARGYSATGVGMGVCARHEFVQPNGVADLQKGERFANMDWIVACILRRWDPRLRKIISYDIVCQWWIHLRKRLKRLPAVVRIVLVMKLLRFVIPKMHIHAHTLKCQRTFSLNLVPGSAQTDGEGIERPWAHIGGVATSTREMGPGSREDTLNCHWGFWNWGRLIGLGERLRTRTDRANREYAAQLDAFTVFSVQQGDRVAGWRKMVEEYESDPTKTNPYAPTATDRLTEAQVLLAFEKEEAERVKQGVPGIHSVSPSSFIAAGLDIEDQQRRVRVQAELKKAGTTAQEIDLVGLRRKLNRAILRFRKLQATYTPAAILALNERDAPPEEQAENVPLFMPLALSASLRETEPLKSLALIEEALRDAQCEAALVRLRNQLHIKSGLFTYKRTQARHVGANTRSRTLVATNESKIRLHSEKYQMAWEALRLLRGGNPDPAVVGWRLLRAGDIRCMEDPEDLEKRLEQAQRQRRREDRMRAQGELVPLTDADRERAARRGENVRTVSWIWTSAGTAGTDAELEEALRIEWCKSFARVRRWDEECRLLAEEARRFPVSMEFQARKWEERAKNVPVGHIPEDQAEGAIVYALQQAEMYRDLAARFAITMTEERRGRGKRRVRVMEDEARILGRAGEGEDEELGLDEDEEELEDWRGDVSDEDFVLDGGEDD
ncbi:CxC2 domain-containing protein [Mycena sanguinolenta]|uniref:CxC2 domain-containing protein n=1 Tax=Mycena sanguinolenta TaxID=230812 RepID=A0A8H7DDV4_9AGAR|nr:CxC2 domain-containing protein [Mycena sanguinolenta]